MRPWALLALVWTAQGCYLAHGEDGEPLGGGDGQLRIQLELPAVLPGVRYVGVQVNDADRCPFDIECVSRSRDRVLAYESTNLRPCALVRGGTAQSVNVRVRLCEASDCVGFDDGTWEMSIETPFYPGETTFVRRSVAAGERVVVERCDVEGCALGVASAWCSFSSGEHFCEDDDVTRVERPSFCTSEYTTSIVVP